MPTTHAVQDGEHLSSIAARYGFKTIHPIWDDPSNAELRGKRNPNLLLAGDDLVIPDKVDVVFVRPTGAAHRFVVRRQKLRLRLTLQAFDSGPIGAAALKIEIRGQTSDVTADGDGLVEVQLQRSDTEGTLFVDDIPLVVKIGALDPADSKHGLDMRLCNLGYLAGPLDEVTEQERKLAIEEFQLEAGLPVTGLADIPTREQLICVHGA